MNTSAVIKGGLAAGLLINVSEFVLNMYVVPPAEGTGGSILFWVVYAFVLGIAVAYVYALARPRCGAGPKSGVCAGVTVWALHTLMPMAGAANMGMVDFNVVAAIWTVAEMGLAGVIAGKLYSED